MKAKKKSHEDFDQKLIAIVEELIAKEPYEAFGFKWAARPQLCYCEELVVCQKTLGRHIRKPPFVARRAQVNGNVVCLLRLGEAALKDASDYKYILRKLWRDRKDERGLLYGKAAQDAEADKAAVKATQFAVEKDEDIEAAAAIAAAEARDRVEAEERQEDRLLWGYAKDVMELAAWFGASQKFQDDLVINSFKYAIDDYEVLEGWHVSNGWDFVASAIKIAMEAVPGGKVIFLDFPSISVMRRFGHTVIYAYVTHLQEEGKAPLDSWKILQALDIWRGNPGWKGNEKDLKAEILKTVALAAAKAAKKAAAKKAKTIEQVKKTAAKFAEAQGANGT
jgi:hypothetical protein